MSSIKELKEKLAREKGKIARQEEKANLEKELFNLRHARKIRVLKKVKGNVVHMGRNFGAIVKDLEKKGKKKKKTRGAFDFW